MVIASVMIEVGKMVGTGSSNGGLVGGDNGAVGVGHQGGDVDRSGGMSHMGSGVADSRHSGMRDRGSSGIGGSLGGQVVGTGGSNGRFVGGDNGAVGVADQGRDVDGGGMSHMGSTVADMACTMRHVSITVSPVGRSLGSQMISTSSHNGGFVNRHYSAVRVGNKAVAGSSMTDVTMTGPVTVSNGSVLGGDVVSLGGGHTGLVEGGDGAVGVTLEAVESLAGSSGNAGSKNLHNV